MVGGLIAANSSTILTHLNWGASYLVHDFYRRFIATDARREALRGGRPARAPSGSIVARRRCSVYLLDIGAGGVRPHPLRSAPAPACSTCCAGSGGASTRGARSSRWSARSRSRSCSSSMKKTGHALPFAHTVLYSVAFTTVCWLIAAYVSAADQPRAADRVLPEGASVGSGLGAVRRGSWRQRRRGGAPQRRHGQGDARLDVGLSSRSGRRSSRSATSSTAAPARR